MYYYLKICIAEEEQIKFGECYLTFSSGSFVCYVGQSTQKCCCNSATVLCVCETRRRTPIQNTDKIVYFAIILYYFPNFVFTTLKVLKMINCSERILNALECDSYHQCANVMSQQSETITKRVVSPVFVVTALEDSHHLLIAAALVL
jgi:hypothetical protein